MLLSCIHREIRRNLKLLVPTHRFWHAKFLYAAHLILDPHDLTLLFKLFLKHNTLKLKAILGTYSYRRFKIIVIFLYVYTVSIYAYPYQVSLSWSFFVTFCIARETVKKNRYFLWISCNIGIVRVGVCYAAERTCLVTQFYRWIALCPSRVEKAMKYPRIDVGKLLQAGLISFMDVVAKFLDYWGKRVSHRVNSKWWPRRPMMIRDDDRLVHKNEWKEAKKAPNVLCSPRLSRSQEIPKSIDKNNIN